MDSAIDVISEDLTAMRAALAEEMRLMAGKSILVTGGAGFLGYYLVKLILHHNQCNESSQHIKLDVWDNYIRGVPQWLDEHKDDHNLHLEKHDITQSLPKKMKDYDFLIHAASIASPTFYRKYPIETMDANVKGLRNLLDYSKRQSEVNKPIAGFLFFSTSEIYGDPQPEHIPTPETYRGYVSCTGPRACYDESKRYGETLCVNYAQQYGLPIQIARPFNNYGPGLKITDRRVLPDFARNVLNNEDIIMLSDGSPTRTFCYVADAVCGYFKILTKGRPGEAYNIGVEKPEISMAELAESIIQIGKNLVDYRGAVIRKDSADKQYLVDNPNRRCPDIRKARAELGYAPSIGIEEGLFRTMLWYRENLQAVDA